MKKYIEIFKYSLKQNMTFKFNYMFSIISLAIHLFVFNELWDYILQGKTDMQHILKEESRRMLRLFFE